MSRASRYAPEVRERAVRMVVEHAADHESEWAAMRSIADQFGCTAETLRKWARQVEHDLPTRCLSYNRQQGRCCDWRTQPSDLAAVEPAPTLGRVRRLTRSNPRWLGHG